MSLLTMQSFGGALALLERTVVQQKRWITQQEFVELFALSQVLPGPTGCAFCILLGERYFGLVGAAAAITGFLALPLVVVIAVASFYAHYAGLPAVAGAVAAMGAASIGLVIVLTWRMATTLRTDVVRIAIAVIVFVAVTTFHLSMGHVIVFIGLPSCYYAWTRRSR